MTMLAYRVVELLCIVLLAHARSVPVIISDYDVDNAHYPFFVEIMYRNCRICGGTIINTRYILTAAGCLEGKGPQDVDVVVGAKSDYEKIYQVKQLMDYEKNDAARFPGIGLIQTVDDIVCHKGHVEVVTLHSREFLDTENEFISYGLSAANPHYICRYLSWIILWIIMQGPMF